MNEQKAPAVAGRVEQPVRPLSARLDVLRVLLAERHPEHHATVADAQAEIERLRAQLAKAAAAFGAEQARADAAEVRAETAQAAERERCASLCENWPTPDCGGWTLDGLSEAIRAGA